MIKRARSSLMKNGKKFKKTKSAIVKALKRVVNRNIESKLANAVTETQVALSYNRQQPSLCRYQCRVLKTNQGVYRRLDTESPN